MNIEDLIFRQLNGSLTENELSDLRNWYEKTEGNKRIYREYILILKTQKIDSDKKLFENVKYKAWESLKNRILYNKRKRLWVPIMRYVAVAAVAFILSYVIHNYIMSPISSEVKYTTIEIPFGSKSKVSLPDGTTAWLNSGTTLTHSAEYGKTNRQIYIDGEGFFDVVKNDKLPFEVSSDNTFIRVLGTKFNIKSYSSDEKRRITLLEGSLSIATDINSAEHKIIVPNEQAVIEKDVQKIQVRHVVANEYVMWTEARQESTTMGQKNNSQKLIEMTVPNSTLRNTLFFDEETLSQIVKDLSRSFNVVIEIQDAEIASNIYYGDFRNEESIYDILNVITSFDNIQYKIENDKIIITKKE